MRSLAWLAFLVVLLVGSGWTTGILAQTNESPEERAVAELAQEFLEALSASDTAVLASLLAPQAMIYSVREGDEGPSLGVRPRDSFLQSIGGDEQSFLERMWNPTAMVQGRVAMVWTPFDFHLNGEFSHCGTNVFTFLKGDEGWQVASITYNVVRDDCPPSPLGPPGGRRR